MSLEQFIQEWEHSKENIELQQIKQYWEVRADEFNAHKSSNYDDIVKFLNKRGIIKANDDILDIGCGPGKLSLEISQQVHSIVGIDISENMIHHAKDNAKKINSPNAHFKVASWEEINLKKEGWIKKFDFVIASMTPGIKDFQTLEKMNQASKRYCLLTSYVSRRDLRNEIEDYLVEKKKPESKDKIYYAFNILWELGYFPEIMYRDIHVVNEYTYEKALEIYVTQFSATGEKQKKIQEFLQTKRNKDGMVVLKYYAKIGWLLWET